MGEPAHQGMGGPHESSTVLREKGEGGGGLAYTGYLFISLLTHPPRTPGSDSTRERCGALAGGICMGGKCNLYGGEMYVDLYGGKCMGICMGGKCRDKQKGNIGSAALLPTCSRNEAEIMRQL